MVIEKTTLKGSSFVGIFSCATNKNFFVPVNSFKKELNKIENAENSEIIKCFLAETSLLGIMAAGKDDKLILSELVIEKEVNYLNSIGIKTKIIEGHTALGNFIKINSKNAVLSKKAFNESQLKEIKNFLKVNIVDTTINGSDLIGSNLVLNDNGFAVSPSITDKEFSNLEKNLCLKGIRTTSNYGDVFIGNSAIANNFNVFAGLNTTGIELMRLEESLSGR